MILLQNVAVITKCGVYYKMCRYILQLGTTFSFSDEWNSWCLSYKVSNVFSRWKSDVISIDCNSIETHFHNSDYPTSINFKYQDTNEFNKLSLDGFFFFFWNSSSYLLLLNFKKFSALLKDSFEFAESCAIRASLVYVPMCSRASVPKASQLLIFTSQ